MAERNKVVYSKELNSTYIMSPDGRQQIGFMEGDQRNNPMVYSQNVADTQNVQPPMNGLQDSLSRQKQMGKDFVVNAISSAPLAFGPENIPMAAGLRAAMSLGGGALADHFINPDKTGRDIAGTALQNTAIGTILPWLAEKVPNIGAFKIPGMRSETIQEPTTYSRTSRGISEGSSEGISSRTSQGSSRSSGRGSSQSEGSTNAENYTNTSGEASSNTRGTSARKGITTSESSNNSETQSKGTSTGQSVSHSETTSPPHDQAMIDLGKEIDRLNNIDTSKFNVGSLKQVHAAIEKNQEALDALAEARSTDYYITNRTGATESSGAAKSTSNSVRETQGTGSSTSQGNSNSKSSSQGQTSSNSKNASVNENTSSGSSTNDSSGKSSGTSQRAGTTESSGSTQPGRKVTTTTGGSWQERILEAIQEMHSTTAKALTKSQKFLMGVIPQTAVSSAEDLNKK